MTEKKKELNIILSYKDLQKISLKKNKNYYIVDIEQINKQIVKCQNKNFVL